MPKRSNQQGMQLPEMESSCSEQKKLDLVAAWAPILCLVLVQLQPFHPSIGTISVVQKNARFEVNFLYSGIYLISLLLRC